MGHLIPAGTGYYKVQNPVLKTFDADGNAIEITDDGSHTAEPDSVYEDTDTDLGLGNATDEADLAENDLNIGSARETGLFDASHNDANLLDSLE